MQDNLSLSRGGDSVNELVYCCARTTIDTQTTDRIRALLKQEIDWALLVHIAAKQGVAPLLYITLSTLVPTMVPRLILDQLKSFYVSNVTHNLLLTNELVKLVRLFQSHGIPVIPYKGPVIAVLAYGNMAFRQFTDLDVLVSEWDYYYRVESMLISEGWRLSKKFPWEKTYSNLDSSVDVDVHMAITHKNIPFRPNFNRFWKHCVGVNIHGKEIKTFMPSHMLQIHCVQVMKDLADNRILLGKLCDIAELLRTHEKSMDWKKVTREAERLGVVYILYLGIRAAQDILGAPLPNSVMEKTNSLPNITSLVIHVRECLLHRTDTVYSSPKYLDHLQLHSAVRERRRDRIDSKYLWLLTPNNVDIKFLEIPKKFFFFYYPLRLIRLLIKYTKKIV